MSSKRKNKKKGKMNNMKNVIKKSAIFIITMASLTTNVLAQEALCVGGQVDADTNNTAVVTNACDALSSLGYHTIVDITDEKDTPVITNITNKYNVKSNTHGVLFLAGHGEKNAIYWHLGYGFYQDGTTPSQGGQLPISLFNLQNTQIAIFLGCQTAKTTNNISKYAQQQGATVTTGWVYDIHKSDAPKWSAAFFKKLKAGKTFRESYKYANSLDYLYNENMKTHRVYGDATITGKAVTVTALSLPLTEVQSEDIIDTRKMVSFEISDEDNIEEEIIKRIQSDFDDEFNLDDYNLEISYSPDGPIYDYSLMIEDAKTTHGYTAMVEDNNIEIYDNMGDFKEKAKTIIESQANSCRIDSINDDDTLEDNIERLISKYEKLYTEYNVSLDSTMKYYDDETDRIVIDINIKVEDLITGEYRIITENI